MTQSNQPQQPLADQQASQALDADQGVVPQTDTVGQPSAGTTAPVQQTPQQPLTNQPTADQSDVIGAGAGSSNGPIKDPEDWTTGDQPMTDAQRSYLDTLATQAGETLPGNLTKAQASEHIDRLQQATGRAQN